MTASLSNQVRLGFSLGWRIWTPNEVGFYAKTLAHSYFIFTILRAKFFTKKMWVVNYSIFIAAAKYLVFVEFIEFGIKTKEERTYWKKIMYISLLIRHAKFKSKVKYTPNFEKMKTLGRFFSKIPTHLRTDEGQKKLYTFFRREAAIALNIIKKDKTNYKNTFDKLTLNLNTGLKASFSKLVLKKGKWTPILENTPKYRKKLTDRLKYGWLKVEHILQKKNLLRFKKRSTRKIKNIIKKKTELMKKLKKQPMDKKLYLKHVSEGTISAVLRRNRVNRRGKVKKLKFKILRTSIANWVGPVGGELKHNRSLIKDLEPHNITQAEKDRAELFFAFRSYVKKRHECVFSIAGGPRKRLFRNIKRSFQGKYIVHYASLIWFWEKISRLITYIINRLTQNTIK